MELLATLWDLAVRLDVHLAGFVAEHGGWVYLLTGRKTVPQFPTGDPLREYYPRDRSWLIPLYAITPQNDAYFIDRINAGLIPYFEETNVTDALFEASDETRFKSLWRLVERNASRFRKAGQQGPLVHLHFEKP